jgi:hypothetical protein
MSKKLDKVLNAAEPCGTVTFKRSKSLCNAISGMRYNRFSANRVYPFLEDVFKEKLVSQVRFGKEYSPVMYLLPTHKDCVDALWQKAKDELNANEMSEEENGEIRVWWD